MGSLERCPIKKIPESEEPRKPADVFQLVTKLDTNVAKVYYPAGTVEYDGNNKTYANGKHTYIETGGDPRIRVPKKTQGAEFIGFDIKKNGDGKRTYEAESSAAFYIKREGSSKMIVDDKKTGTSTTINQKTGEREEMPEIELPDAEEVNIENIANISQFAS